MTRREALTAVVSVTFDAAMFALGWWMLGGALRPVGWGVLVLAAASGLLFAAVAVALAVETATERRLRARTEPPMVRFKGENIVVPVPAGAAAGEVKVVMRARCDCPGRGVEDLRLAPGDQFVFPCCGMRLTAWPGLSDGTVTLTVTGPES